MAFEREALRTGRTTLIELDSAMAGRSWAAGLTTRWADVALPGEATGPVLERRLLTLRTLATVDRDDRGPRAGARRDARDRLATTARVPVLRTGTAWVVAAATLVAKSGVEPPGLARRPRFRSPGGERLIARPG